MSSRTTYQFCNNCGKQGHLYNQCKKPIISSGIIAFRNNENMDGYEYLMICRKDSLGYIDFLRGKYPLYDKDYILTLINEMTTSEKENLLKCEFSDLWRNLWGDFVGLQYRGEERSAKDKLSSIFPKNFSTEDLSQQIKKHLHRKSSPKFLAENGRKFLVRLDSFWVEGFYLIDDLDCIATIYPVFSLVEFNKSSEEKISIFSSEEKSLSLSKNEMQEALKSSECIYRKGHIKIFEIAPFLIKHKEVPDGSRGFYVKIISRK